MKLIYLFLIITLASTSFSQQKVYKYFNEDDSIVSEKEATTYVVEYLDEKTNHIYKEFYNMKDNELTERAFYLNDTMMDGLQVKYLNHHVWDSGYMKMGARIGITYFYHGNGKLASIINFDNKESVYLHCYNKEGVEEKCDEKTEQMPEFPGGIEALKKFLVSNIKYPKKAMENAIQGRVIVKFYVDGDGVVKEPVVMRSVNPLLDEEAVRVMGRMPPWKPGKQFNRIVKVYYTLPVTFSLQ